MKFIDNKELKNELSKCHSNGELSNEFSEMAIELAKTRFAQRFPRMDKITYEDFLSEFLYVLVRKWQKIDPERNPRGFIYTVAARAGFDVLRKKQRYNKKIDNIIDTIQLDYPELKRNING